MRMDLDKFNFFYLFPKFYEIDYFNFSEIIWEEKVYKLIRGTKFEDFRKKSHILVPSLFRSPDFGSA